MNKAKINELLPEAYTVLQEIEIAKEDKINKTYQRLITSFGAAVYGGSLLAAIAFFSEEAGDKNGKKGKEKDSDPVIRPKLMMAIYILLTGQKENVNHRSLFQYVQEKLEDKEEEANEFELRDEILDAAISLKLAMNLYKLVKKTDSKSGKETEEKDGKGEKLAQGE